MDEWLHREFTLFGIHSHLPNWMLVMIVIAILGVFALQADRRI
jgi:hypothetical protein